MNVYIKKPTTFKPFLKLLNECDFFHSYNSINMDGTLMCKAMHADPENYVTSMAPGQYWTWGTQMKGMKGKSPDMLQLK